MNDMTFEGKINLYNLMVVVCMVFFQKYQVTQATNQFKTVRRVCAVDEA